MGRLAVAWELLAEQLPSLVGRLAVALELLVEQLPSVLLAVALELLAEQLPSSLLVGQPPLHLPGPGHRDSARSWRASNTPSGSRRTPHDDSSGIGMTRASLPMIPKDS